MILSKLLVALGIDAGDYNRGLDDAERTAGSKAQAIGDKLGSIGDKMTGIGTKLTVGVTAPIVAMGVKSIDAASDVEESMSKVGVVFGDSAGMVQEFASTADTALGQSRQQALDAAGTFGNLFVSMGMGQEPAADMSTSLVTLASDLASFNNTDPTTALDALRAGLTGETEPLKRFGVNLNAATISAKALELGLVETAVDMERWRARRWRWKRRRRTRPQRSRSTGRRAWSTARRSKRWRRRRARSTTRSPVHQAS